MADGRNDTTIDFSAHALEQMTDRGATRAEVRDAITTGERIPAKKGRCAFRKNFPHNAAWQNRLRFLVNFAAPF